MTSRPSPSPPVKRGLLRRTSSELGPRKTLLNKKPDQTRSGCDFYPHIPTPLL